MHLTLKQTNKQKNQWNSLRCKVALYQVSGPSSHRPASSWVIWSWQSPRAKEHTDGLDIVPPYIFCSRTSPRGGWLKIGQTHGCFAQRTSVRQSVSECPAPPDFHPLLQCQPRLKERMSTEVPKAHHAPRQDLFRRKHKLLYKVMQKKKKKKKGTFCKFSRLSLLTPLRLPETSQRQIGCPRAPIASALFTRESGVFLINETSSLVLAGLMRCPHGRLAARLRCRRRILIRSQWAPPAWRGANNGSRHSSQQHFDDCAPASARLKKKKKGSTVTWNGRSTKGRTDVCVAIKAARRFLREFGSNLSRPPEARVELAGCRCHLEGICGTASWLYHLFSAAVFPEVSMSMIIEKKNVSRYLLKYVARSIHLVLLTFGHICCLNQDVWDKVFLQLFSLFHKEY